MNTRTSLHVHHLNGCAPRPLALYLKAIGILRLVGEQADRHARGWWQDEHFCLLTKLDRQALERFFLEEYAPTPIFNPWGGRSGFYDGSSEKNSRVALVAVEDSDLPRLSDFRHTISKVRQLIETLGDVKPDSDEAKRKLVRHLRQEIRDGGSKWLATVLADLGDEVYGPPILGTGGNEGSGSYTAAYFAAIRECIVLRSWDDVLPATLFSGNDETTRSWDGSFFARNPKNPKKLKKEVVRGPFRQFLPEGNLTPWDLILTFEGTCAFRSGVAKRSTAEAHDRLVSSPFYFAPHGVGGLTSCDSDEFVINKGRRQPGRGEQWFPLWHSPVTCREMEALFCEGRCSVGRKQARKPIDAARAIGRLGLNRGITDFVRYGYLQRNNLATHFAVPLGRIRVQQHSNAHLVDDLAAWLDRLQKEARRKHAPARLVHAERRLADAVFAVLTHDDTPQRWQAVLEAAVEIEMLQRGETALGAGPLPRLQAGWVAALHDNSPEVRLALALGSAAAGFTKDARPVDPVRHHWLPLERGARRFQIKEKRLVDDPRVVMTGRDALADLAAVAARRLLEAEANSRRVLPLQAARGCAAALADLAELIDGHVDLTRVLTLGRALMALDWRQRYTQRAWERLAKRPRCDDHPDEAWLALRLACLPWPIEEGLSIPAESSIISRLISGDATAAVRIAAQRLGASGIRVPFTCAFADAETARLWAAALAFPISHRSARRAVELLVFDFFGVTHA